MSRRSAPAPAPAPAYNCASAFSSPNPNPLPDASDASDASPAVLSKPCGPGLVTAAPPVDPLVIVAPRTQGDDAAHVTRPGSGSGSGPGPVVPAKAMKRKTLLGNCATTNQAAKRSRVHDKVDALQAQMAIITGALTGVFAVLPDALRPPCEKCASTLSALSSEKEKNLRLQQEVDRLRDAMGPLVHLVQGLRNGLSLVPSTDLLQNLTGSPAAHIPHCALAGSDTLVAGLDRGVEAKREAQDAGEAVHEEQDQDDSGDDDDDGDDDVDDVDEAKSVSACDEPDRLENSKDDPVPTAS